MISVTVTAGIPVNNVPPTISLSVSPTTNLIAPASIVLAASAADSNGTIARVEFFVNGAKLIDDPAAPYSYTLANMAAGSYQIFATAGILRG